MISDRTLRAIVRSPGAVVLFGDLIRVAIAILVVGLIGLAVIYHAMIIRFMFDKLHMNDFGKFYYSARLFLEGRDMYGPSPATAIPVSATEVGQFLNMNPPHFHLAILPFALLAPDRALQAWIVVNLAAFLVSLWIITRELGLVWSPSRALWVALGVLVFSSTGAVVVTGQLTFLLMLMMTLAWRAARRGHLIAAACWLGVLTSIKPFLAIFGLYFLARRRMLPAVLMGAAAVGPFAAGLAVFGWQAHVSWLNALRSANWTWPPMNGSITGFFARALSDAPLFTPVIERPDLARVFAVVCCGAVAVWSLSRLWAIAGAPRPLLSLATDRAFALLLLTSLLLTPLGWVYYLWLPAGPLLAIRRELMPADRSWRRWILIAAIPGALCPLILTSPWESAWTTITLGSAYFWLTAALWLAVVLPAQAATPADRQAA